MFSVELESTGILRLEVAGFLSRDAAEAMFKQVQEVVPGARKRSGGPLKSIGVAKAMPVQMALSLDYLARIAKMVFARPDDRAGLVITSMLAQLQMGRILPWEKLRVFADEGEARAWLASLGQVEETLSDAR